MISIRKSTMFKCFSSLWEKLSLCIGQQTVANRLAFCTHTEHSWMEVRRIRRQLLGWKWCLPFIYRGTKERQN